MAYCQVSEWRQNGIKKGLFNYCCDAITKAIWGGKCLFCLFGLRFHISIHYHRNHDKNSKGQEPRPKS